ncbi:sugar phosphate isomerase/epimerase family protein [Intestinimonas sp. HCP28S3_D6]|uniref:sugar phosphate isomerase/epimerase family protein n=1 Tax=Intestinimonas sp. HCP28S3_D6 TaxID=3438942 RepID=UPI003F8B69D9
MPESWTLLGSNGQYVRMPLAAFLGDMRSLGLTALDFVPQSPHLWLSHAEYEEPAPLLEKLAEAGLRISVLTPPAYRYSITAPPGKQREATVDYYRNSIALARALGAGQVVLGAAGACWDLTPEALRQNAAEVLERLCPAAEAAGVSLLLAPVMGPDTPLIAESPVLGRAEELSGLLRRVGSPALGVCLDTNVMASWGDTIPRWFELLGEKTGLVRLCDGNYHGWRAWGEGCLPMDRFAEQIRSAGYAGALSLLLPRERYVENPDWPLRQAVRALTRGGAA